MSDPLIIWQKWSDPFWDEDQIPETENNEASFYADEEENLNNTDNTQDKSTHNFLKNPLAIKVIATPLGIVPITENTASGKIFNFWVGHTNFDITKKIADIIETTEGVETLDIYTRYRFRIAVGKAFSDSDVMRNINKKIYQES